MVAKTVRSASRDDAHMAVDAPEGEVATPFVGQRAPHVGRRIRVWFVDADSGQPDYDYGTVTDVHGAQGPAQEVSIEWDTGEVDHHVRLANLGRVEWLGDDIAADLIANLKDHRQESVEGIRDVGGAGVTLSLEQLRQEQEALRWMRDEVATRSAEADRLRQENEALKAQRREFQERFGEQFSATPDKRVAGDADAGGQAGAEPTT